MTTYIHCFFHEKISDVIKRYRVQSNDQSNTKKFIFNAYTINEDITVSQAGLLNDSVILVVETKGVRGG